MKLAIFTLLAAVLLHAALSNDMCSRKNLKCGTTLKGNYMRCLIHGYSSGYKCQATTVLNLPYDPTCCHTIEKRLFNCVKKEKINFDCMQYEDEEDEILH
ncbi:hypothetical protein ACHWQZ_G002892 [Mnemiopsis leidyi]